jgi:twitching motility protein PilT
MLSEGDRLFGRVAIISGILGRDKLKLCIKKREKVAPNKSLGLFLLEDGHISQENYNTINSIRMDIESQTMGISYEEREAVVKKIDALMDKALEEFREETKMYEQGIVPEEGKFTETAAGEQELEPPQHRAAGMLGESESGVTAAELAPFDSDLAPVPQPEPEVLFAERHIDVITEPPEEVEYLPGDYGHLLQGPLDEYLITARELGASDLHFSVGSPPFLRVDGRLVFMRHPVITAKMSREKIFALLGERKRKYFLERKDVDFTYDLAGAGRYRTNIYMQRRGISASFRVIYGTIRTLEDLDLPAELRRLTEYSHGIVLVTGPAGCGKSTTLAALVDIVNKERKDHIVMIEEPIEFVHESFSCNVTQREVRKHTESFHVALRASLREDPDVIVVGELRDLETISMAITSAETGHLVFGTLHTTNATRTVDRILDVFPPREQEQIRIMVSESLRGAISQQLLPRADGKGRVPAVEVLFNTHAVSNLIREHKTFQLRSVIQTGRKLGMVLMDDSINELLNRKLITRDVAAYFAEDPSRFAPETAASGRERSK